MFFFILNNLLSSHKDILNDDYTSKISLKCKSIAGPVAVTIETERGSTGALSSKIGTKFSYAKFNVDKGQLTADGGSALETSIKLTPDIKLSFKTTKGADLGVDYTLGSFYATGVLDVQNMSKVSTSACYALPSGLKVGGDATYALSGKTTGLAGFNIGASYSKGPIFASVVNSKFSTYNVSMGYNVSPDITIASLTTHSAEKHCNIVGVGAAYKNPSIGTLKAKIGSDGILHACLIQDIAPKVTLTASGSMSATDPSTFKPGFGISI